MSSDRYSFCFRLNLKNPRHAEIANRLGTLNKKVFKSRSEFLIKAAEHYIACLDSGDMHIPEKSRYITEADLEERVDQLEKSIRLNLYEDMLKILTSGSYIQVRNEGSGSGGSGFERPKDVDLTKYGDIMKDIENWSSN